LSTKRLFWHPEDAQTFYAEHAGPVARRFFALIDAEVLTGKFYVDRLVAHASSGPSMALLLGGPEAITRWRTLIGPTKAYKVRADPLRAT
jgi:nucleoside-diphosphate kinase